MVVLSEHTVFILVAELGIILLFARIFGEIAQKLGQPIIVGEVAAGILLGPQILGNLFPDFHHSLFPQHGSDPYILQGVSWLCVIFLLMITGLEIDLRASLKQGRNAIAISLSSITLAIIGVFIATNFLPNSFFPESINPFHVKLMISIALSVVAIPVIAKILFDLKIVKSEVGVKILTSGVLSDVWGWALLAIFISIVSQGSFTLWTIAKPLLTMFIYLGVTLSVGQKFFDWCLNIVGYKTIDTTVALSAVFTLALINGAVAHLLGVHVIFGAFVAGVMAGESEKISPYVRQSTQDFIFAVFAPIFFVLIGMQLRIPSIEVWIPILFLLVVSSILKIGGAYFGGFISGIGRKNAFAVACGLNTQGTMGIIIALIAYEMNVLNETSFSSIVLICILTSLLVGPLLKWAMKFVQRPLAKYFDEEHVFLEVEGANKKQVIANISRMMKERQIIKDAKKIEEAIWDRELTLSTAIGDGVALPHARLRNQKEPILCFFRLKHPIDYGSPDNKPVNLLFLELTDKDDEGMQLNLIAQVARFISVESNREKLQTCQKENEIHQILSIDEAA